MTTAALRFDIKTPEFFAADPKKITVEETAGRIMFLLKGKIVATAIPVGDQM